MQSVGIQIIFEYVEYLRYANCEDPYHIFANCKDPDHNKNIEPDQYEYVTTEDVDVIDLSHIYANRVDPDQYKNCEVWDHCMHANCLDLDHKW